MKSSPARPQAQFARIVTASCLLMWAMVAVNCETLVPRQGWSKKWGPMVPHETFPGDCNICHVSDSWDVLREDFEFDHHAETGFALEGAHADASCLRCHNDRGPVQAYFTRGCGGCHVDSHKGNLGLDCTRCHNQDNWSPSGLITEHARTRFPLIAGHAIAPCEACHNRATVGDFRGASVECEGCHQIDALQAVPNHVANGWINNCEECHGPVSWAAQNFNHDFFPLIGGHAGVDCLQCHAGGQFQNTPNDCFSCHQNDYIAAPDHVAQNFSTDCTLCHNVFDWN